MIMRRLGGGEFLRRGHQIQNLTVRNNVGCLGNLVKIDGGSFVAKLPQNNE